MAYVGQLPTLNNTPYSSTLISKLTSDILWLIFTANTNDPEFLEPDDSDDESEAPPRPLDTTRLSSQVCREWRRAILESSSLWGRLLDWRLLNQETDHWRNEVLKRSGTSPLWVNAGYISGVNLPEPKESTLSFFSNLLNDQWDRLERFAMSEHPYDQVRLLPTVFQRAAPNLKAFDYHGKPPTGLTLWPGVMFAGHAPQLKSFRVMGARCNLDSIWTSGIQSLYLGSEFFYQEACEALRLMPLLETLGFYNHENIDFRHARIHLPRLRTFKLTNSLQYINDIEPAPGCSILFDYGQTRNPAPLILESYETSIIKLLRSYLSIHPVNRIFFECTSYKIGLSERPLGGPGLPYYIQENVFEIKFSQASGISDGVLTSFLKICTSPGRLFSTVTDLVLVQVDFKPQFYHTFMNFMSVFPALERVCIDDCSIPSLLSDAMPSPILFLNVQTLAVSGLQSNHPRSSGSGSLERFLASRRDAGFPIKTLDLTDYKGRNLRNLDFLEQFVGTRVVSQQEGEVEEYVCGSGWPEALQFSS